MSDVYNLNIFQVADIPTCWIGLLGILVGQVEDGALVGDPEVVFLVVLGDLFHSVLLLGDLQIGPRKILKIGCKFVTPNGQF